MSHSVNTSGCSYTTLQNYNGYSDDKRLLGDSPSPSPSSSSSSSSPSPSSSSHPNVVVPIFGGIGYNILNGGLFQGRSDSGYFNVTKAYGDENSTGECKSCRIYN